MFFPSLPSVFLALGKEFVCRVPLFFPSLCFAALDKELVCRVPDRMHSANIFALDKSVVSSIFFLFSISKDKRESCLYI